MKNTETTQGANVKAWDEGVDVVSVDKTTNLMADEANNGSTPWYNNIAKDVPRMMQDLESNALAFTIMIVSVIGYIVIAAFGQMDSTRKYLGYILFLILIFCGYKTLKATFFRSLFKKINKIILLILIVLVMFIVVQNFSSIVLFSKFLYNILKITGKP